MKDLEHLTTQHAAYHGMKGVYMVVSTLYCSSNGKSIGEGTIFRLGKQKFVKNNQDNQIQSITLYMQYVFFEKGMRVQWGLKQSPRSWGIIENFDSYDRNSSSKSETVFRLLRQRPRTGNSNMAAKTRNIISISRNMNFHGQMMLQI